MRVMATASTRSEGLRTRGAQVLARFLPLHEEHAPLGFGLKADAAVLRVGSHVGDAARLATDPESSPVTVAVPLTWAAATALAAIPRLSPVDDPAGCAYAKDELLAEVDRAVAARLPDAESRSATDLVALVTAPLGDAFAAMAGLAHNRTLTCDGLFNEEPLDEFGADETISDALFEVVVAAVVAAELLEPRGA